MPTSAELDRPGTTTTHSPSGGASGFRVGDWFVQPDLNRVSRGQDIVQLEPKIMDLLVLLAERSGRVVPRAEIIESVWQGQRVANSTVSRCMALLRQSLGDDARSPSYVETISKRGYRLIAGVKNLEKHDAPTRKEGRFRVRLGEREIPLHDGENVVGRLPAATVPIDSPKVSRRHARIVVDGSRATLEDMESKNGTFLGGKLLTSPEVLSDGDEIIVGSTAIVILDTHEKTVEQTNTDASAPILASNQWGL